MIFDLEKECICIEDVNIDISKLIKVGLLDVTFKNIKITFAYSDDGDYLFMYSDAVAYAELLKAIAGNRKDVRQKLLQYRNDFGVEHALWKQLLQTTCEKFDINCFTYADEWNEETGLDECSDYFSKNYYKSWVYPREVKNMKEAYDLLNSVLPQNYSITRRNYLKQKAEERLKEFTDICGKNFENKENYLARLETFNRDSVDKWSSSKEELQLLTEKIQELVQEGIFDAKRSNDIQWFLEYCINYVCDRVNKLNENALLQQYGPVSDLKKLLRESINRLGFMELLDLFKEYKGKENVLCSKARRAGMKLDEFPFREYIDIYRLGSILISDKMNRINRNKAKNKYIPQDLLDEALIFYYDTESAKEAYSIRSNEKYSQDKQSGDKGERKVEYALKWLDKSYIQIEKKSNDKVGDNCIYILNADFIDEKQEYDHLIVSNKGVFIIETKNYMGKLVIDPYGNWIRKKNGTEEGMKNPLQQIRQHEKVLMSFLPKECNVISIICIANDKAIIEGSENCPIPIVKSDMLVEFIENWNGNEAKISDSQMEQCVKVIYEHMI